MASALSRFAMGCRTWHTVLTVFTLLAAATSRQQSRARRRGLARERGLISICLAD